jgi:hypothetical protein
MRIQVNIAIMRNGNARSFLKEQTNERESLVIVKSAESAMNKCHAPCTSPVDQWKLETRASCLSLSHFTFSLPVNMNHEALLQQGGEIKRKRTYRPPVWYNTDAIMPSYNKIEF